MKKISIKELETKKQFYELKVGDIFLYDGNQYMKISLADVPPVRCDNCDYYVNIDDEYAVDVMTGQVMRFSSFDEIYFTYELIFRDYWRMKNKGEW